jgi:phosphoribosylformylglycinamidine cyclo-ligase
LNALGVKTWQLGVIETASDVSGFITSAKGVEGGAVRLTGVYA